MSSITMCKKTTSLERGFDFPLEGRIVRTFLDWAGQHKTSIDGHIYPGLIA